MKRYKVVMMVPNEILVEQPDLQSVHNQVTRMIKAAEEDDYKPILHSVECLGEVQQKLDPDPAA